MSDVGERVEKITAKTLGVDPAMVRQTSNFSLDLGADSLDTVALVMDLEDEFTMTAVSKEIETVDDIDQLRLGALNLLKVAMHRQAVIRGLCKRLAKIETYGVQKKTFKD